jgi:amino-acid N-acetyltransferase
MQLDVTIRQANTSDVRAVKSLLSLCGLPTDDLAEANADNFLVFASGEEILGVCGTEAFREEGLLRSLAVVPGFRGQKIGERLVAASESKAIAAGVKRLYLLTTTARDYLLRLGYLDVARESVPEPIRAHPQFQELCPASASCLVKKLV